jgi:GntR family transcriptional regulator
MSQHPSLTFRLDPQSGLAPYRQLVEQVRHAVRTGLLRDGDQLPSVRDVVTQITINPNTVHRAYRELEHEGIAEGRPGLGTFITLHLSTAPDAAAHGTFEQALQDLVISARRAGLNEETIRELMRTALRQNGNVHS